MRGFPLLPRRKNTDKSDYGHALIVAGSRGMVGAAFLASRAALKSGAGLVTLATPKSAEQLAMKSLPEILWLGLPETSRGSPASSAFASIVSFIKKRRINSVAIGPGLSTHPSTAGLVRRLVGNLKTPIVLDADGLNAFKGKAAALKKHAGPLVLTPHRREFERLFSKKFPSNLKTRRVIGKQLSAACASVIVLKGDHTLVVDHQRVYENETGNPGLAKGGTGDVLTGMIVAFMAQGLEAFEAAKWAVYFHGKSADFAVKEKGELGLAASDVIDFLPKAFRSSK